ncbi:BRCA1 C Terminus domain protein [Acinetobacter sp. 1130196]|uniref:BRCT domain-containing protein n=1 Tax=Acinetobacter sp. 1130196 TaxID=1310772 RepID=UPI000449B003|nr:BRCT domain-containing protein [Acinetobacter sp. 1130196]EXR18210.1 BRCA1 C Terminus domain protein [Acinetobacter sp. 1130196]
MDKKIENLDEELINRFMGTAIIDKEINNFLGFLEGIILDHTINKKEIYALQVWMERNPEIYCQYPFDHLIHLLGQTVIGSQKLDEEKCKQFVEVIKIFISGKFYSKNTRDVQRLHGLLAGGVCDGTLSIDEAKALNTWMKEHDYLEDDVFFQEVYTSLRPVRTKQDDLTDFDIQALFKQIKRYVDPDDHGTLRTKIETIDNPDFFKGQLLIENALYCFTGTSSRFKKKDWKALIENNGGKFIDDMTTTVNYLVICNKGNKAWAHVSYGRKFEEAKKWQQQGHDIKIITEDDFIQAIGLPIEN